jgi:hypothetical protein
MTTSVFSVANGCKVINACAILAYGILLNLEERVIATFVERFVSSNGTFTTFAEVWDDAGEKDEEEVPRERSLRDDEVVVEVADSGKYDVAAADVDDTAGFVLPKSASISRKRGGEALSSTFVVAMDAAAAATAVAVEEVVVVATAGEDVRVSAACCIICVIDDSGVEGTHTGACKGEGGNGLDTEGGTDANGAGGDETGRLLLLLLLL